ncbi:flagellar hook-associated protein FlgK [Anaeromyxobacter paludicola]|uniref:Flagellar hook-associated protein 1 n=1 Tax=Anaeromyxobacter paludicola TaxID=2918171 RepID=A0ABN6N492_9BACT|nr:flagellar hook-associated protein FlgK [Anaeromyxobacter paludicola]BDG08012.1 flagellar hook-associated protein 1 [Anaeromyxobacter paludicola]
MADLFSILSNASSSLAAQQAAMAVTSNNLQNAATPGYARQRAELLTRPAELVSGGAWVGRGVTLGAVTQVRDQFIESQVPASIANAASSDAEATALSAIHTFDPAQSGGVGDAISGFYSALRALSQNPGDSGLREAALGASQSLAAAFNQASRDVETARTGLDDQAVNLTGQINALAKQMADLNTQVRQARASGGEPNDLLDARQQVLDQLASLVGGQPVTSTGGDVNVMMGGGVALVSGGVPGVFSSQPDPNNRGHLQLLYASPLGTPAAPLANSVAGGQLGGTLAARDGALGKASTQLDTLAFDLANQVNAVHQAGYGADGVTGRPLFAVGATSAGAASTIAISAAVGTNAGALAAAGAATAASGDADNVQALLATEQQALPTSGLDATRTLSSITSSFGIASAQATSLSKQDAALRDNVKALRESASGVSVDEELVNMQKTQRAYEAIARVLQTSSDMLDVLMKLGS